MGSDETTVRLFRETLLWPLEVAAGDGRSARTAIGDLASSLEAARGPWQRIADPRRHLDPDEPPTAPLSPDAYQEIVYFHPFVRRFLFPVPGDAPPALHLFRRTDVRAVRFTLSGGGSADPIHPRVVKLAVDRIVLYLFDCGIALLAVEVSASDGRAVVDAAGAGPQPMTVADAQTILSRLRRVYPPFWRGDARDEAGDCVMGVVWSDGGPERPVPAAPDTAADLVAHLGRTGAPPAFAHWRRLLAPLRLAGYRDGIGPELRQVVDDRMPTMALLGVADPRTIEHGDWVRLCFADGPDSGLPYAERFLADFAARYCYDRFWQADVRRLSTRFLCSGYQFAIVAADDGPGTKCFLRTDLEGHFRRHYFQLGLLNQVQKAALLSLSDALSRAVGDFAEAASSEAAADDRHRSALRRAVQGIQARALEFTHRYWFTDVSNQMQGQELFAWWRDSLGTVAVFDQVMREVADSNAFLDARDQDRMAKAALRLNRLAGVGLVLALVTGALGMNILADGNWDKPGHWAEAGMVALLVVALVLVAWTASGSDALARIAGRRWVKAGLLVAALAGLAALFPPARAAVDAVAAWLTAR